MANGGSMRLQIRWGDVRISMEAEGVSYSPDVLVDMVARALEGFRGTMEALDAIDIFETIEREYEMEDDPPE